MVSSYLVGVGRGEVDPIIGTVTEEVTEWNGRVRTWQRGKVRWEPASGDYHLGETLLAWMASCE